MAKKTRTPPPPRKPGQGPARRDSTPAPAPGTTADDKRTRLLLLGFAAAGVVALIAVVAVILTSGGGSSSSGKGLTARLAAGGCTLKTYPSQGQGHYATLTPKNPKPYNSFPPTSGKHYFQPALWGNYPTPVNEFQAVHNLEHGGIVIQYGDKVPQATVDKLDGFYQSDPNALLMAPLPKLGSKVALTAWTHLATCTGYDEKAYAAFRDAYRYKAPEKFPPSALNPGQ
ncbi:MAG: DUF3105 domain-containing protein [Gaiellaceae bacterium]